MMGAGTFHDVLCHSRRELGSYCAGKRNSASVSAREHSNVEDKVMTDNNTVTRQPAC